MRCQSGVSNFAEFNGESSALASVWVIAFLPLGDLDDHADPLSTSVQTLPVASLQNDSD